MLRQRRIFRLVLGSLVLAMIAFFVINIIKQNNINRLKFLRYASYNQFLWSQYVPISPSDVLQKGNGILFVETTVRLDEPSLVLCSIESAARIYPDRPVVFFMKGLHDIVTEDDEKKARKLFPALSSYKNIYIVPMRLKTLFADTPLQAWYEKINATQQLFWTHIKSDACRFSLIWKYGGIYMDTDVISIRPVSEDNFLSGETDKVLSCGVFSLSPHHNLSWEFMENFVQNYRGNVWGHQGPAVVTRVMKKYCGNPKFTSLDHVKCANVSYFHSQRFYPIPFREWRKYFMVWKNLPTFNNSYALHLWNYMNKEKKFMMVGSNTLVEHLYQQYCPSTYESILKNVTNHH